MENIENKNREIFQFQYQTTNRNKKDWGRFATIDIHATDRKALELVFRSMIENDKSGVIKEIFEKALLLQTPTHLQN